MNGIKKMEKKKIHSRNILAYDMDGSLCKEICWTKEECLKATPNKELIEDLNNHYNDSITIIYTARRDELIGETITWLRNNGVHYWAINNQKMPADLYYDDKCINVKDL